MEGWDSPFPPDLCLSSFEIDFAKQEIIIVRCDHRYKLVGYRDIPITAEMEANPDLPIMNAVMACLKCPNEKLVPISVIPPAPIIHVAKQGEMEGEVDAEC